MKNLILFIIASGLLIYGGGCATISAPAGGIATVTITENGLVETMAFEGGPTLNLQINHEDPPLGEFLPEQVLTIGTFSPVVGSGFSPDSDIYYQERIGSWGRDVFQVEGRDYLVTWEQVGYVPGDGYPGAVFAVTVDQE